jgi:cell division septum initiation protein DivIVA
MRALAVKLVIAASFVAHRAHAEPTHDAVEAPKVTADRLFQEGRALAKDLRNAEACARFAQTRL